MRGKKIEDFTMLNTFPTTSWSAVAEAAGAGDTAFFR
jgi:hypothetical protein